MTTSNTRSRPSFLWVWWRRPRGPRARDDVPPNTPSSFIGGSLPARLSSLSRNICVICPGSIGRVSDASEPATHVLVRVWLPDRPGMLGLVASRIGAVDGDIVGIDVLERGDNVVVDEFAVLLRKEIALDLPVARSRRSTAPASRRCAPSTTSPTRPGRARIGEHPVRGDERRRVALHAGRPDPPRVRRQLVRTVRGRRVLVWRATPLPTLSVLEALVAGTAASLRVADGTTGPDDLAVAVVVRAWRCAPGGTRRPRLLVARTVRNWSRWWSLPIAPGRCSLDIPGMLPPDVASVAVVLFTLRPPFTTTRCSRALGRPPSTSCRCSCSTTPILGVVVQRDRTAPASSSSRSHDLDDALRALGGAARRAARRLGATRSSHVVARGRRRARCT